MLSCVALLGPTKRRLQKRHVRRQLGATCTWRLRNICQFQGDVWGGGRSGKGVPCGRQFPEGPTSGEQYNAWPGDDQGDDSQRKHTAAVCNKGQSPIAPSSTRGLRRRIAQHMISNRIRVLVCSTRLIVRSSIEGYIVALICWNPGTALIPRPATGFLCIRPALFLSTPSVMVLVSPCPF